MNFRVRLTYPKVVDYLRRGISACYASFVNINVMETREYKDFVIENPKCPNNIRERKDESDIEA